MATSISGAQPTEWTRFFVPDHQLLVIAQSAGKYAQGSKIFTASRALSAQPINKRSSLMILLCLLAFSFFVLLLGFEGILVVPRQFCKGALRDDDGGIVSSE